jgi:hypothetical protein
MFCFDAFSSREPVSNSLESAMARQREGASATSFWLPLTLAAELPGKPVGTLKQTLSKVA